MGQDDLGSPLARSRDILAESERVIAAMADLIDTSGLWKGHESPHCGHCIVSAVVNLTHEDDVTLRKALYKRLGFADCVEAINWNDVPERTKEEVVARLRNSLPAHEVSGLPHE